MKHEDVKNLFQDWTEGRVDDKTRPEVQEHLDTCDECRTYFEKMAFLLEKPDPALLPRLEPDAFLPAKVRALSERRRTPAAGKRFALARLSFVSAAFVIAVAAGVFLGTGLSKASYSSEETEIVEAYYEAFSQSGFADDWENVMEEDQTEDNGAM